MKPYRLTEMVNYVVYCYRADVGGQHCPCPVFVSFSSGFSGKSCLVSV